MTVLLSIIKILIIFPFIPDVILKFTSLKKRVRRTIASFFYGVSIYFLLIEIFENMLVVIILYFVLMIAVYILTKRAIQGKYRSYQVLYTFKSFFPNFTKIGRWIYLSLFFIACVKEFVLLIMI